VVKHSTEEVEVSVQYRPAEYMALVEMGGNAEPAMFDELTDKYKGTAYFSVSIKKLTGDGDVLQSSENDRGKYYDRLKYFSEDIKNDVYVLAGHDTVPCVLNHLERTYKLTPYTNMLFAFEVGKENITKNEQLVFVYDDRALNMGKQSFKISTATIKKAPIIKF
jgi:hypothetical protein